MSNSLYGFVLNVLRRRVIEKGACTDDPESGVDKRISDAHIVSDFEGAGRDTVRAAIRQRVWQPIDNPARNPMSRQFRRHGQSNRAGADYKNLRGCVAHERQFSPACPSVNAAARNDGCFGRKPGSNCRFVPASEKPFTDILLFVISNFQPAGTFPLLKCN
jgi:hypothetical protein